MRREMGGSSPCTKALQKQSQHGGMKVNQFLLTLVVLKFSRFCLEFWAYNFIEKFS